MAKYQERKVSIEAWQVGGPGQKPIWAGGSIPNRNLDAIVDTIDAQDGEWIVQDHIGRLYVFTDEEFTATYETG